MPKALELHPAERVDKVDLEYGTKTFPRALADLRGMKMHLDNQSYILHGFRVELPDQTAYPGRIVIHGGFALDHDGRQLHNEEQLTVSRTITLEGVSTDFYVEAEFVESDSDVDARAFWDPTVDQGTDVSGDALPDGQEFGNSVTTRKTPDWQIVTPINTSNFDRLVDPASTKIPIIKLSTNGSNEITAAVNPGLVTELPATTLLDEFVTGPPAQLRVVDPQHFPVGTTFTMNAGGSNQELALQVAAVDLDKGLITTTGSLTNPNTHVAGEILRATGGTAPTLITEGFGRFSRSGGATAQPDRRDMFFQGDEVHGEAISEGHDTTPDDQSDDVNIRAMKQYVDFLASQIQEMKWGHRNPYVGDAASSRAPPGNTNNIPTIPRYFHRSGGVQGARTATATVGDGINSWGDFNGADETGINAAIASLPVFGGTVVIKNGVYTLANDVVINKGIRLVGGPYTSIKTAGGAIDCQLAAATNIELSHLSISRSSSITGIKITTSSATSRFVMDQCILSDVSFDIDVTLQEESYINNCRFQSSSVAMGARALVRTTVAGASLKGVWHGCTFDAVFQTGITAACIDASVSTVGLTDVKFLDCKFSNSLVCTSQVEVGAGANRVAFERCLFTSTVTNSTAHVIATSSGFQQDLSFIGCKVTDALNRFLSVEGVTNVLVDGLQDTNAPPISTLQFVDCSRVKVVKCSLSIQSLATLTEAAIEFSNSLGTFSDACIQSNSIQSFGDYGIGISFDIAVGGSSFEELIVSNNDIRRCEVGIYFGDSGGSGVFDQVTINGNQIADRATSSTQSAYQKIGILAAINVEKSNWVISDNEIINCNPPNTNTVGGAYSRAGIAILGTANSYFTVTGNVIRRVGDSGNELISTRGIRFEEVDQSVISGNTINLIRGVDSGGISICDSLRTSNGVSIAGNNIVQVYSTTSSAAAILFTGTSVTRVTIEGNTIATLGTSSGVAAAIYSTDLATGTIDRLSIIGNCVDNSATGTDDFIYLRGQTITHVTIRSNVGDDFERGILIEGNATSTVSQVAIDGNAVECDDRCIDINLLNGITAANCQRITITSNTLLCTAADSTNIVIGPSTIVACTGNTMENTGTHTVARGQNIFVSTATVFTITGNVCRQTGGATGQDINIELSPGVDKFSVFGNVLDMNAAVGDSIRQNGIAPTANGSMIAGNVSDTGTTGGGANGVEGITTTTNGQQIVGPY